jgi:hypothetical protein
VRLRNQGPPPQQIQTAADPDNAHEEFLDSQENFDAPQSWWHGRESSCEDDDSDDGEDCEINVEGGGLEGILTWPPELLYACDDHERWGKKRKGATRAAKERSSMQEERAGVGREETVRGDERGNEVGSGEGAPAVGEGSDPACITGAVDRGRGSVGLGVEVGREGVQVGEPNAPFEGPSWAAAGFWAGREGCLVGEAGFSMYEGGGWGWEPGPANIARAKFPTTGPMLSNEEPEPINTRVTTPGRRPRRARVPCEITQLSEGSFGDISEYETEEEADANTEDGDMSVVKHVYRDETWSTKFFTYDPKPKEFIGRRDTIKFFAHMPSLLTLFELFWPFNLLHKIVLETNRYASYVLDALGNMRGVLNGCRPLWRN